MGYSKQPTNTPTTGITPISTVGPKPHFPHLSKSKHTMGDDQHIPHGDEIEEMVSEEWREAPRKMPSQSSIHSVEQSSYMHLSQRLTPGSGRKVVHGEENDDVRLQIQQKCVSDGIEQCMHILIPNPETMQHVSTMKNNGLEKNVSEKQQETEAMEVDEFVSKGDTTNIYMGEGKD